MIYLFNDVYIAPDKSANVRPQDDAIFISATMPGSSYHVPNFFSTLYGTTHKQPLYTSKSFDELIQSHFSGDEQKLFDLFTKKREGRLIVFCDSETMLRLVIRAFKTMLPNANVTSALSLIKHLYLPYYYQYDSKLVNGVSQTGFRELYLSIVNNETTIREQWVKTRPWKISREQRQLIGETAGIELQTATYFSNNRWTYGEKYKKKVVDFARNSMMTTLTYDIKQKLLDGFVDIKMIDPSIDPTSPDVFEQLAAHPVLNFLVDDNFNIREIEHMLKTYDANTLFGLLSQFRLTSTPEKLNERKMMAIASQQKTLTFENVMSNELQSICGRRLIGTDVSRKMIINTYLFDAIFDMYKHNDFASLRTYSLESLPEK